MKNIFVIFVLLFQVNFTGRNLDITRRKRYLLFLRDFNLYLLIDNVFKFYEYSI